ncbi:type II toxin-antitoxin system Phd/YefM family antitoxin [Mucilaginibacter sp. cycad4]|uniref:type II toxin-antitoxin system Phd/YefM family antitoxin n=1 Tax=Mucilaginibacter sp. cycad4 TaxID=3342096 RepID=UPI002AAAC321|nr:type II toxin-antitoxin system Phd/YefM family antitoxin [Mucilaginibacter gossypii]WPU99845.1 type II toxin-antitoxin system Phd/YefM family antitoxin [Mucilaginibacter gossypii]
MKVLTVSSLRNKMQYYLNEVSNNDDIIVIPGDNGEDDGVVIVSIKEYNALIETSHLLFDNKNSKRLMESIDQIHSGKVIQYDFNAGKQ